MVAFILRSFAVCLALSVLVLILCVPRVATSQPNVAPPDSPILLGMSAAFTGPSRGVGIEFYRGAMTWFTEVNQNGGMHGRKIRILTADDGYHPGPALRNTRDLLKKDNVLLLFGAVGTPTTSRILPLLHCYRQECMALFCPVSGAETLREGTFTERIFPLRASYRLEAKALVEHFLASGVRKVAVLYQIDSYGRSGWDGVRRALAARGLEICGEATYRRGAVFGDSMQQQVELLRKSEAEAVICVAAYEAAGAFIRDARDAGWQVPIANVSFVGSESLLKILDQQAQQSKRNYTEGLLNSQVVPSWTQNEIPAVAEYCRLMDRHSPRLPDPAHEDYQPLHYSFVALEGFLSAKYIDAVLREAGPHPTREKVVQVAEKLSELDLGLRGKVVLDRKRRNDRPVWLTVVEKGRFVPLQPKGQRVP